MSASSERLFGQDKNLVIAVASTIILVCAIAMLGVFVYQGVNSGWSGQTIFATLFSSVIAFIFVSLAVSYGFVKGKEAVGSAVNELSRIRAADKQRSEDLAKEISAARAKVAQNEIDKRTAIEKQKKETALKSLEDEKKRKEIEARVKAEIEKDKTTAAENAKAAPTTGLSRTASTNTQYGAIPKQ